ncbi:hypothetical protein Tco_1264704 [Tanacetum coccineum]
MNTTQAQQKALADALVASAARLEFGKSFLVTAEVPAIYMQEFWAIVTIHKTSIRFTINKKKFSLDVEVENKDTKKTNKMLYPRFTKVIIDYFMSKDQSISRRNKMFWHTARDDTMFTSMRCVSKHEKTYVYGAILLQHLTNQAMLESIAYQTYYAYATGEKAPKEKLKSLAKVAKTDKKKQPATTPKTKGLAVLSEVALTEAEQIKLATKRSKKDFHMSHASGSGDGVNIQSKVPDEQQQKVIGTNEGAGVRPEVPDVPKYTSDSEEESWTFSQNDEDDVEERSRRRRKKTDDEEVSSNQRVSTPSDNELTEDEENQEGDDKDKEGEQEQDEEDDLHRDVNINLEISDAKMTDAQANKDIKDAYVTLTAVPLVVQKQSSSVSSDLVSKFINPSPDTDSTTTITIPTMTLPDIPNFASLFRFEQRVSALETEMSEFKQTNQFAEAVSSISGIVDNYLASKMKEVVDVVVQLQSNKLREEAQAENQEFLNQVYSSMKAIIKE